jgi:hypothetical protein
LLAIIMQGARARWKLAQIRPASDVTDRDLPALSHINAEYNCLLCHSISAGLRRLAEEPTLARIIKLTYQLTNH